MIDSVTHSTIMPPLSEPHFSWTDLLYSDTYPIHNIPSPGVPTIWTSLPPEHWTNDHVCDWLQYCCDSYKLDASYIPFSRFNVSGVQLCSMTKEDFVEAAGLCGQHLYSLLQDIRAHGAPLLSSTEEEQAPSTYIVQSCQSLRNPMDHSTPGDEKPVSKMDVIKRHKSPNHIRPGVQSSHLWEFLRDLLLSPEDNDGILDWEDKDQGIFRVVKSEALARMWGQRKRNDRMNYEKLSRALRHYYKTGILERVDRRLVYKFGKNSYGWH